MEPLALEVRGAALKTDPLVRDECEVELLDLRVEPEARLEEKLQAFRPSVAGLTGITIDYAPVLKTAAWVKAVDPSIVTVVGGHHATMVPRDFYQSTIDFIVRGQGVTPFPRIVRWAADGGEWEDRPGVLARRKGGFSGDPDGFDFEPAHLPRPDRSLVEHCRKKYRLNGYRWGLLVTAQGCPYRCSFCACWKVLNGKYLVRDPDEVVDELAAIPEGHVFLGDNHTFGNVRRAEAICERIKERGIRKVLLGYCRADTIVNHPDTLKHWAEVGLRGLVVGFEALDSDELEALNKRSSVEINEEANRILIELGIDTYAHFIVRPDFTEADFDRIWDYIYRQGIIQPVLPTLTPLPGTELRASCGDLYPDEHQYYDLAHPVMPINLPPREYYRQIHRVYRKNFSFRRWARASAKRAANRLRPGWFLFHETRTPPWYAILATRLWIGHQLRDSKMAGFYARFPRPSDRDAEASPT
jgi:radical SAM superfamily enzyme YgiQ (UPF0313 family)